VLIHQDAAIYASILQEGEQAEHALDEGRIAYVHLIRGSLVVNGTLKAGDALKLTQEAAVTLTQAEDAEVLVFDLPK
jgi:redox-sensitive bicupin YhaK (pirin superfamily)